MGKNILVGQSGGPSAVINASLYGVIKEGFNSGAEKVYGMVHGIEGFIKGDCIELNAFYQSSSFELLKNTPAAFLGSCRYKMPVQTSDETYSIIFERLNELEIGYFFYIGGNDSMDTVDKLSAYAKDQGSDIKFIGIPKTIDNDLAHTDHTPGYGSAAKYVAATIREISLDACAYPSPVVTIVEIMGRNAGWLTASAALARKFETDNPYLIHLPEIAFSPDQFMSRVEEKLKTSNSVVVAISEGIKLESGKLLCEDENTQCDAFGHKSLSGCAKILENMVKEKFHVKGRSVELSVTQRAAAKNASLTDIEEAVMAGICGVKAAMNNETGKMVAYDRVSDDPYKIEYNLKDVSMIANQEKKFPLEWISPCGTDILAPFYTYALPLIHGEPTLTYQKGLPEFAYRQ